MGFVTTALHAKHNKNRIGNEYRVCNISFTSEILQESPREHRVCNHWCTCEIMQNSQWSTNIEFVTIHLHTKYFRNRIGNEHMVCNHWFTCEILQISIGNLHTKYNRNWIGNEHTVCNLCFTYEIWQKSIGNEHGVFNFWLTFEILQKLYWERT